MSLQEIGNSIKERRKILGITQPYLAELANISVNTLYKVERGQGNPTIKVLLKITEILGLEIQTEVKNKIK
ncbi:MAG: helix-turn-helix transcriptional regulator [Bacteroidales bacterium]|nr:helix-turn-helix transcriptional regulator [Bacteroidales bacterium]